ncbi:MAG: CRTAC1 family protein [Verrucomicrobiae bacterium]|nr:CRTAC1 family protein [Verrucomicrobiae bacterium]
MHAAVRALALGFGFALPCAPALGVVAGGEWTEGDGFRLRPLAGRNADPARVGFTRLSADRTGIRFVHRLDEADGAVRRVLENGAGVAAGDYDGDGRPDVFLASLSGGSALYRNLGDWRFREVTDESGLGLAGEAVRGAVFADLDGDGHLDLLVATLANGLRCFMNCGDGRFRETTREAFPAIWPGTTTLALADVDGDGTLDLYVVRYRAEDVRDDPNVEARVVGGRTVLHPKYRDRLFIGPRGLLEYGEPDVLLLNDGTGRFRAVSWTGGAFLDEAGQPLAGPPRDWGLAASFRDVNGDGLPDLYVCNDYWTPDRFWINAGQGRFRAAPLDALRHTSENSMGVDFADLDGDGEVDFLVLDMLARDPALRRRQALAQTPQGRLPGTFLDRPQVMRNTLFLNRGNGTFAEIADFAGLAASDWSWQPLFLDVDLDGFDDVIISTGHRRDIQDLDATARVRSLQRPWPPGLDAEARLRRFQQDLRDHNRLYPSLATPMVAFRQTAPLRFEDVSADWGFRIPGVHQGFAAADFDGDGDLDLVINALDGPVAVYRNEAALPRLAVRLIGLPPNTEGIGAVVTLQGGAGPVQSREAVSGGRYLSGGQPLLVFATGPNPGPMKLTVRWRDGRHRILEGVRPDRLYEIRQPRHRRRRLGGSRCLGRRLVHPDQQSVSPGRQER